MTNSTGAPARLSNADVLLSIIDNLPTSIFVKDENLRFVLVNKACQAVMNTTEAALLGRSDADFFAPDLARGFMANDRKVFTSGEIMISEETVMPENGRAIVSQTRKARHAAPDGRTYLIGTNTDLSAIKAREEQYRVLSEAVPVGVMQVLDSGEVLFANKLCLEHLGLANKPRQLQDINAVLGAKPAGFPADQKSFETEIRHGETEPRRMLVSSTGWLDYLGEGTRTAILSFVDVSEMTTLRQDLEVKTARMFDVAELTRESVGTISSSTAQLADGAAMLATQTSQQMVNLREITTTVRELSHGVRQNSGDSERANKLALEAKSIAERGNSTSGATVAAMGRIMESSRKIDAIVGLVNEIAFQTNILALNAAVEAARAGDAGRGFAVVATEVRALAQRSAQALKDIRELMRMSSTEVDEGSRLVDSLGQTLGEISKMTQDAAGLAARIAQASTEQSAGILQVDASVVQLEQAASANADLVQNFSRAVEAVDHSMSELANLVGDRAA